MLGVSNKNAFVQINRRNGRNGINKETNLDILPVVDQRSRQIIIKKEYKL